MKNKVCRECGAVNEERYTYCKNCGTKLDSQEESFYTQETVYVNNFYGGVSAETIEGVPTADMVRFVGKNSYKIIEKWSAMELGHKKTGWCWPVFLLTFFFGICGAGFWFLYRRMYKFGVILLALSLALGIFGTVITMDSASELLVNAFSLSQEISESGTDGGQHSTEELENKVYDLMTDSDLIKLSVFSNLSNVLRIAAAVLLGIFSLGIYKSFAAKRIKSYNRPLTDVELYLAGGTSGGAAAVGVVFYIIAKAVVSVVGIIFLFSVVL